MDGGRRKKNSRWALFRDSCVLCQYRLAELITHGYAIGFKYNQNSGRQEIIKGIAGGDANKKKYYSGCCQFIKEAKKVNKCLQLNVLYFLNDISDHATRLVKVQRECDFLQPN